VVPRDALESTRAALPVISTRLTAGRTLFNVVADAPPAVGFAPVAPSLGDVYFAAITGRLASAASAPAAAVA